MIIGQHLFTKDGGLVGNGIIVDIHHKGDQILYDVETDFGNVIHRLCDYDICDAWNTRRFTKLGIVFSLVDEWRAIKRELVNQRFIESGRKNNENQIIYIQQLP